jgi:hypothetical protein
VSAGQDWLPEPSQELLLRVALGQSQASVERDWADWKSQVPLADIEANSFQILPLVYRNLTRLGIDDPAVTKLSGVYRYTWSRHQLLVRTGGAALSALANRGIPTMVLKGPALALVHYRDLGVRTMFDFDLLVPHDRVLEAMEVLDRDFLPEPPDTPAQTWLPARHSCAYRDAAGREVDLHWFSLWHSAPDHDFWEAARPTEVAGMDTNVLCPTDQLLHAIAHGAWWSESGRLRWVADAVTVIRTSDDGIDWSRFQERAEAHRVAPNLVAPLCYLRDRFAMEIPSDTITSLARTRYSLLERAARRAGRKPSTPGRELVMHLERYRRVKRLDPGPHQAPTFASAVGRWIGCETYPELAVYAGRRLLRRPRSSGTENPSLAS